MVNITGMRSFGRRGSPDMGLAGRLGGCRKKKDGGGARQVATGSAGRVPVSGFTKFAPPFGNKTGRRNDSPLRIENADEIYTYRSSVTLFVCTFGVQQQGSKT